MITNKKTKKREITRIVVRSGISGPVGPEFGPRLPLKVRVAQQTAGIYKAGQKLLDPRVLGPIAFVGTKKIGEILLSDTLPHMAKGFAKGGMDGVRAQLLAEYTKQPHDLNDPYQKALKVGLDTSIKYLSPEQRHHVATQIKKFCGEDLLNQVRNEFPSVPPNPDIPFFLYTFVSKLINWTILCFVLFFLFEAYFLGVQEFNESYKNRGDLSDNDFLIEYFSPAFYLLKPIAFDYNSKIFVLNSCFIADDTYLLSIDDNFYSE